MIHSLLGFISGITIKQSADGPHVYLNVQQVVTGPDQLSCVLPEQPPIEMLVKQYVGVHKDRISARSTVVELPK